MVKLSKEKARSVKNHIVTLLIIVSSFTLLAGNNALGARIAACSNNEKYQFACCVKLSAATQLSASFLWVGGKYPKRYEQPPVPQPSGSITNQGSFCSKIINGAAASDKCSIQSTLVYASNTFSEAKEKLISASGPLKTLDKVCYRITGSTSVKLIKN